MMQTAQDVKPLLYRRELAALRLGVSLRTLDELLATKRGFSHRCTRMSTDRRRPTQSNRIKVKQRRDMKTQPSMLNMNSS